MTRWGVLADIHGNLPALERTLTGFRERGVERIAVLGDNLGRGNSEGCVARIREVAEVSVLGNRDLDWQDRVDSETRAYVLTLPRVTVMEGIAFAHGDARLTRELSSSEIRTGFRRTRGWLAENGCTGWLFGHTHRARVWRLPTMDGEPRLLFDAATDPLPARIVLAEIAADQSNVWVVNAGSVGLPFPGKGPASATILDAAAGTVEFFPLTP